MATNARKGFLEAKSESLEHTDNAMSALNEALDDLGKLKVRVQDGQPTDLSLSLAESRKCVDIFLQMFSAMFMVDIWGKNGFPDVDSLYSFPELVRSPYVTLDPGLHVLYYNAMFYGLYQLYGPNDARTPAAYRKVLDSVPAWLAAQPEKDLDGWTAAVTAWTAIVNFDYQLSWKFHCKSCHYVKKKGLDRLDAVPAATHEEETIRNELRPLYWHSLYCDMFFRLFYGKPSVMQYSPIKVKPMDIFGMADMRPKASQVILTAVIIQNTIMTAEILHFIDVASSKGSDEGVADGVERFCCETEDLIADWNLVSIFRPSSSDSPRHGRGI
jgi:hypothetical protein